MKAPIESKVLAATGGAGLGGAFGTFVLWLLGVTFWHSSAAADQATTAVASVPEPVGALIVIVVAGVGALISGYVAPHTSRPDLHAAPAILGKAFVDAPAEAGAAVVEHGSLGHVIRDNIITGEGGYQPAPTAPVVESAPEAPAPSA